MTTLKVSLSDELSDFVEERVRGGAYGSTSEYVRDLIRHDRDRATVRQLVDEGLASPGAGEMDDEYLAGLRSGARPPASDLG